MRAFVECLDRHHPKWRTDKRVRLSAKSHAALLDMPACLALKIMDESQPTWRTKPMDLSQHARWVARDWAAKAGMAAPAITPPRAPRFCTGWSVPGEALIRECGAPLGATSSQATIRCASCAARMREGARPKRERIGKAAPERAVAITFAPMERRPPVIVRPAGPARPFELVACGDGKVFPGRDVRRYNVYVGHDLAGRVAKVGAGWVVEGGAPGEWKTAGAAAVELLRAYVAAEAQV